MIKSTPPAFNTGHLRYDFQIACARQANGRVLNVGCNEDPPQLRQRFGNRIVNCDREGWDEHMNRPNAVDRIFDALVFPWPFEDDSAEMVLLGDILEHFPAEKSIEVLKEARRIAQTVCVTVPEDTRIDEAAEHAKWREGTYNLHTTIVTREVLDRLFAESGWEVDWLLSGDWGFDNITGWCVRAHRLGHFAIGGAISREAVEEAQRERAAIGYPDLLMPTSHTGPSLAIGASIGEVA